MKPVGGDKKLKIYSTSVSNHREVSKAYKTCFPTYQSNIMLSKVTRKCKKYILKTVQTASIPNSNIR